MFTTEGGKTARRLSALEAALAQLCRRCDELEAALCDPAAKAQLRSRQALEAQLQALWSYTGNSQKQEDEG